ncbi:hypothetical protein V8C86DRAFT_2604477 [Haematococcus lacustris]
MGSNLAKRLVVLGLNLRNNSLTSGHCAHRFSHTDTTTALQSVAEHFKHSPIATAEQLVHHLTPVQRAALLATLIKEGDTEPRVTEPTEQYVSELSEAADTDGDKGRLTRVEFTKALQLHAVRDAYAVRTPPTMRVLGMIALASALPFVGFGFLDNSIMLVAGEEIDHVFGIKLGLSTLASAGLGNLVADVIGVSAANGIEASVRKLPLVKSIKLSKHQLALPATKRAKAVGASVGVAVGCLLGLAPLVLGGTFWDASRILP